MTTSSSFWPDVLVVNHLSLVSYLRDKGHFRVHDQRIVMVRAIGRTVLNHLTLTANVWDITLQARLLKFRLPSS